MSETTNKRANYKIAYSAETLRSGQPRAYADTEREYLISVSMTQYGKEGLKPGLLFGDIEKRIARDEKDRAAGIMFGGESPETLRKNQGDWARKIVRALCQNFREKDDEDGRTGMDAHFYPTLKFLKLDHKAGTIHAFIVEPYTD